ncbi:hypothetical protein [Methylobacterium sp. E-045]|uniref:DUF7831 domain-containing protein n=1 Tax=Methylobacterium sp. E-045 TaxID=2836575 RepID=UPI001FBA21D2|nr:hypothetical protein [Methylobacterium sp. E-045]MCJ2128459.1 hypothetical protein [Methylobacterium sp. E-045]
MIRYDERITRAMLRAEPDTLFVFGDNLLRKGLGGQAKEMRGEPNAVGIPTKREPTMRPAAFFSDNRSSEVEFIHASEPDIARLRAHLMKGGTVVLPEDGIGTGLADLERRSPRIWARLQSDLAELASLSPSPAQVSGSRKTETDRG